MDTTTTELMQKVAQYIERTQPLIDQQNETLVKQNEQRNTFIKRATQAAGVLAHQGVIDRRHVNEFIDKVASDPTSVWEFIEKLAAVVPVDALGEAVQQKMASGQKVCPFERMFFGVGAESSGTID